jgi:alkylation response protein AidB-like acyl-CoA dehydrogenase
MDADDLALLRDSVRRALAEASGPAATPFAARLEELGWADVVADDRAAAWTTLFDAKGESLAGVDALDLLLGAEAVTGTDSRGAVVVLPAGPDARPASGREADGTLVVSGIAFRAPAAGETAVVPVARDDDPHAPVELIAATIDGGDGWNAVGGLDPDLGLVTVHARVPGDRLVAMEATGAASGDAWTRLLATARVALAAELVGVARRMVGAAAEYASARIQYGRPIGTFQAVQHRLAEAHALTAGAAGVVAEAWTATEPDAPWCAVAAKALAGEACERAGVEAQQVFGAIGFTWEHDLHRALRRGYVLDTLLGDWRTLARHVGGELLAGNAVPRIGSLARTSA